MVNWQRAVSSAFVPLAPGRCSTSTQMKFREFMQPLSFQALVHA